MARRSDHTRDELVAITIDAAWKIVGEDGFAAATARRVAKEIGYAPGTIYNLFGSMDDLYLLVSARTLDTLHEAISVPDCPGGGGKPADKMKAMAKRYRDFAGEHKNHWIMLFVHNLPDGKAVPTWFGDKVERIFQPLEELLEPFFLPLDQRRRRMAARVLWGSVHGLCFLEATGKIPKVTGNMSSADLVDNLIDTFVAGLERTGI